MNLIEHLHDQREWSTSTFGPGHRTDGVIDHIRKELIEIEADPLDLEEWVDVILLALDGAWRSGAEPEAIALAITAKMGKNKTRQWPDWRGKQGSAIEHIRDQTPENTSRDQSGPAFPCYLPPNSRDGQGVPTGMTKREYFAAAALTGFYALSQTLNGDMSGMHPSDCAKYARVAADDLIRELSKEPE